MLTGLQLVKKFPAFYGTRRFITALTSVRLLSLSSASPIQSIYPYPTSWRSILILSTHLRLGLPSGFRFPHQDPIRPPLPTHTRHMPGPSHSSRFYHPHNIGWGVRRWRNSVEKCRRSVIKRGMINCWSIVHLLVHCTNNKDSRCKC